MFDKKPKKQLSDAEIEAKMEVLQNIMDEMDCMMKGDMAEKKGLRKVTVASDSPQGLKAGLEKAKDIVGKKESSMPSEEEAYSKEVGPQGQADETSLSDMAAELNKDEDMDDEIAEDDALDEDELDAKIAKLMAMKQAKKAKI